MDTSNIILISILISQAALIILFYKKFTTQEKSFSELNQKNIELQEKFLVEFEKIFNDLEQKNKSISDLKETINGQGKQFDIVKTDLVKVEEYLFETKTIMTENFSDLNNEVLELKKDFSSQSLQIKEQIKTISIDLKKEISKNNNLIVEKDPKNTLNITSNLSYINQSDKSLEKVRTSIEKLESEANLKSEVKSIQTNKNKEKLIKDFLLKTELKNLKENKK